MYAGERDRAGIVDSRAEESGLDIISHPPCPGFDVSVPEIISRLAILGFPVGRRTSLRSRSSLKEQELWEILVKKSRFMGVTPLGSRDEHLYYRHLQRRRLRRKQPQSLSGNSALLHNPP